MISSGFAMVYKFFSFFEENLLLFAIEERFSGASFLEMACKKTGYRAIISRSSIATVQRILPAG
jgi:hypothetical protein